MPVHATRLHTLRLIIILVQSHRQRHVRIREKISQAILSSILFFLHEHPRILSFLGVSIVMGYASFLPFFLSPFRTQNISATIVVVSIVSRSNRISLSSQLLSTLEQQTSSILDIPIASIQRIDSFLLRKPEID